MNEAIAAIWNWIWDHYDIRKALTPVSAENRVIRGGTRYNTTIIGYTTIRIFGIKIIKIQRTLPWE